MNVGQCLGEMLLRIDTLEEENTTLKAQLAARPAPCTYGEAEPSGPDGSPGSAKARKPHGASHLRNSDHPVPAQQGVAASAAPEKHPKVRAKDRILRILDEAVKELSAGEIEHRDPALYQGLVSNTLTILVREKLVVRTGAKYHYRYSLARKPA